MISDGRTLGMGKAVDRPYVVSVSLSEDEMSWLRELVQLQGVTEERVLRRALRRLRNRELKRQVLRIEIDRLELAG
jgi:hypothetical protein